MNGVLHQRWLVDIVACIGFYTRVPIPRAVPLPDDFAAAQWAAPLAGLLAGGIGGTFLWLGHLVGLPAELAAALSLASMLLATGCFHEDGLGDVCDGFGGGNTAERKLEIMRDSRIGTFGMCGLTLSLLARWSAITALATVSISSAILAILAAHMAARAPMALFMHVVPAARTTGLSAKLGDAKAWPALLSLGIGLVSLLVLGPSAAIAAMACLAIWFMALRALCLRQIGGHTGDVLGTLEQGGEIIILFIACIFLA